MSKHNSFKRWIAALLAASLAVTSAAIPASAADDSFESLKLSQSGLTSNLRVPAQNSDDDQVDIPDDQVVRVSIVLWDKSTIDAGYGLDTIAVDEQAVAYRESLSEKQESLETTIENKVLGGKDLDVVWNLTLAANIISANVKYGQIEEIKNIKGVKDVFLETKYEASKATVDEYDPNMMTSSQMIGSNVAYESGYKGAGSVVAVIDTGIDSDHQSFNNDAYLYALEQDGYTGDTLTQEDVAKVLEQLNIYANGNADAEDLHLSDKVPFAYNYVDGNYDITHDNDTEGEHGSHVTGIAAANRYIPDGKGGFVSALDEVNTQGVAPDAQVITMKVFGTGGGAYDADYMAAIEDAIILGADSINLSLGSSCGFSHDDIYQDILDKLADCTAVVTASAGNSGTYADNAENGYEGYLYGDDVNLAMVGNPSTFTNALSVASIDNVGATGDTFTVGGHAVFYTESTDYNNPPYKTIAGEHDYILLDNIGVDTDNDYFDTLKDLVKGKIAMCYRGTSNFSAKANAAAEAGAVGVIIVNNQPGVINMDLSDYTGTVPAVSITQADGEYFKSAGEKAERDGITYYTGTMTVNEKVSSSIPEDVTFYTMSDFSSWGVPGSLEMKPEITAPGGNIYSVNGLIPGGTSYENMSGTSMAAPQVAGMVAVLAQYIREEGLTEKTGLTERQLMQSLLMSTAEPVAEGFGEDTNSDGNYSSWYSILVQGAGLANVGAATQAHSYILMDEGSTLDPVSASDGKVKAELGDDPDKTGEYSFSFSINNFYDNDQSYILGTDMFTQDLFMYSEEDPTLLLDRWTTSLDADVTYTVDGVETGGFADIDADVNKDGVTNSKDAQALLDYIAKNVSGDDLDLATGDVDGDEKITTYDAHLILAALKTLVTVPAGGSVDVTVDIALTDDTKAILDEYYENGAYVEGFTFINAVSTEEGVLDVSHSIPILGFYGSWTDATMFDRYFAIDEESEGSNGGAYDLSEGHLPYTGNTATNILSFYDADMGHEFYISGNPYAGLITENGVYPFDRVAINSADKISSYMYTLIRNAGELTTVITDAETGEVLKIVSPAYDVTPAYYYDGNGTWQNTRGKFNVNVAVKDLGVKEGDAINVSLVAVPEYYGRDLTADQITELVENGELGDGAFMTTRLNIDDTAPVITNVGKNNEGDLRITVKDNQYVAAVSLISRSGAILYGQVIPDQKAENEEVTVVFTAEELAAAGVRQVVNIEVIDYAFNITTEEFTYSTDPIDFSGEMFGFFDDLYGANTWVTIDPETISVWDDVGMEVFDVTPVDITAAAYADDYVFQVGDDGVLYVAPQVDPGVFTAIAALDNDVLEGETIIDMAFNYADSKLYALSDAGYIYEINPLTGYIEFAYFPYLFIGDEVATIYTPSGLAIDAEGNFYLSGINDNDPEDVAAFVMTKDNSNGKELLTIQQSFNILTEGAGRLAWDYDKKTLYMANDATPVYGELGFIFNALFIIDLENEEAYYANEAEASLFGLCKSLYVVPSEDKIEIDDTPATKVESLNVSQTEVSMLEGGSVRVTATVSPWTLKNRDVTWTSADEKVATVDMNGLISAVSTGSTTVTAAAAADPNVKVEIKVTVESLPSVPLRGFVNSTDGEGAWSKFNSDKLSDITKLSNADMPNYRAGMAWGDYMEEAYLFTHDGSAVYLTDAETFEYAKLFDINPIYLFSDAAPNNFFEQYGYGEGPLMVAPQAGTAAIMLMDPIAGSLFGPVDLSSDFSSNIAAIAWIGLNKTDGIDYYACLCENGDMYLFMITFEGGVGTGYIGNCGLDLSGVSSSVADGNNFASMIYDFDGSTTADQFVLSYYSESSMDAPAVAVIKVEYDELGNVTTISTGKSEFDATVSSAVSLYQYVDDTVAETGARTDRLNAVIGDAQMAIDTENVISAIADESANESAQPEAVPGLIGSTNAIVVNDDETKPDTESENVVVDTEKNTITVKVDAVNSTNGLFNVEYDAETLTLDSVKGNTDYFSFNDKTTGNVVFDYAAADALNKQVAELVFTYDEADESGLKTNIILTYNEDGKPSDEVPATEDVTVELPEVQAPVSEDVDVSVDLGGKGTSDAPATAPKGEDLTFTITPAEGYKLPANITVTVDGTALDAAKYTYDPATGKVTIKGEAVTGNIAVTAVMVDLTDKNPSTGNSFAGIAATAAVAIAAMGVIIFRKKRD